MLTIYDLLFFPDFFLYVHIWLIFFMKGIAISIVITVSTIYIGKEIHTLQQSITKCTHTLEHTLSLLLLRLDTLDF